VNGGQVRCRFCPWTFTITDDSEFVLALLAHDFHLGAHVAEMIAEVSPDS